jgi:uncharacterized protein (DUF2235 family)
MSKNIVLLSDGTGNSSSKIFKTNVWRMFQTLDLTDASKQIAYYDNGVGTSSFKPLALLGELLGIGLKRNVIDIYSFCCRNYVEGDKIYGFGFSRGAFTMRVVIGIIVYVGLVKYKNEADLAAQAEAAYRKYRKRFHTATQVETPLRWLRDLFTTRLRKPIDVKSIEFLGMWDTVDAYGGPIDEITRAIDYWFWPLSMPDRFMNAKVKRACHALSLHDERDAFKPVIWDERYVRGPEEELFPNDYMWPSDPPETLPDKKNLKPIDRQRISQVWFVGVHCDIGGGYPQDGLSYVTLDWMIKRAAGLQIIDSQREMLRASIGPYDMLNDSRSGLAGYYRYDPRNLREIYSAPPYKPSIFADLRHLGRLFTGKEDPQAELRRSLGKEPLPVPVPVIHQSVFDRIKKGVDSYAPYVIPAAYRVTDNDGAVHDLKDDPEHPDLVRIDDRETGESAKARVKRQEAAWDLVWKRRVVYFLTVGVSLLILALPFFESRWPGLGTGSPFKFLIPVIDGIGHVLPSFASYWTDAFKAAPERLAIGLLLLGFALHRGGTLKGAQGDCMRAIWLEPKNHADDPAGAIYKLRTGRWYRACFYMLKNWALPTLFMALIGYTVIASSSRVLFAAADGSRMICSPGSADAATPGKFGTIDICTSTGLKVEQGITYKVTLTIADKDAWYDGGIPTGPNGFGLDKTAFLQKLALPLRRLLTANWFATVLRVGRSGYEEHVLNFGPGTAVDSSKLYTATFKARSNGDVYVFVNDAVIGLPWIYDVFYQNNNRGAATISLEMQK